MFWSGKPQFNTAQGYSEYVKEQERQQQIQDAKERQQQQYNADMRQIAQDALTQAKKSNDIAKENGDGRWIMYDANSDIFTLCSLSSFIPA